MTHLHVNNLQDYIEFDDDMVNKIHLIETEEAKIKLIALKKHQELPPHKAEGEAMLYVLEGEVKFYILEKEVCECNECMGGEIDEEHSLKIKKGEFIRFNEESSHKVLAEKDTKLLITCIK